MPVPGGYFRTGQRPRKRSDVNPRTNPRAAGPPAPVPRPHGRRNQNVFTTPIGQKPFHHQEREAARHVARAILHVTGNAPNRPLKDEEVRRVLRSNTGRAILKEAERITRPQEFKAHRDFLDKAAGFALGSVPGFKQAMPVLQKVGIDPGRAAGTSVRAGVQTLRAGYEDPFGVTTKTVTGAGQLAVGAVAAIPEVAIRTASGTAHGDPLQGIREIVNAAAKDVSRRYGPLYRGEKGASRQFRERIKKEGAASEIVDAASILVPEGAILGRSATSLSKAGVLGKTARRIVEEPRPNLRISAERSRPQDVHPNFFRAAAQRGQDAARRHAAEKRAGAREAGQPVRGLQPREGEVVKLTRRGQEKAQRVDVSRSAAQIFQSFTNEQNLEIDRGARQAISKLNRRQRRAIYPVLQGYVNLSSPEAAVRSLRARNEAIIHNREAENAARRAQDLAPREVGSKLHDDEVRLNEYLIKHAKEIFGDGKLKEFQAAEAERSIRVAAEADDAHPAFKSSTAEARRLKVQGDHFGIEHKYNVELERIDRHYEEVSRKIERLPEHQQAAAKRELDAAYNDAIQKLTDLKPEADAEYAFHVRRAAREAGLPEPGYISHQPRGEQQFSDFAPGGARAIRAPKPSRLRLHSLGIADTRPERYIQSLARTIKYKHNWPGVARQAEDHSFDPHEFGSLDDLRNILGRRNVRLDQMSIEDWRRILHAKGLDPRDYAFWNPGILRMAKHDLQAAGHAQEHLDAGAEGSHAIHEGWKQAAVDEERLRGITNADQYVQSRGWKLLPREAYNEITSGTNPSGVTGRTIQKVQGFQSRILLGTNPTWLTVQVASNALLGGFGVVAKGGNPAHLLQAQRWYSSLSPEAKKAVDEGMSIGVGRGHGSKTHLGSTAESHRLILWARSIGELPAFQKAKKYNPIDLLFAGDEHQNAFFRKTVLYSSVKRQALKDIGRNAERAYGEQRKIAGVMSVKDPRRRMQEIVNNPQLFERHAEYVNNILGDFSRYTAKERRTLKRALLFYGFLRYSLRFLFYTLPVKHPLAAAATAKLAQLHNEEVKELLGGPEAPWAYSRIFFEKDGKLRSIDLGRANPLTNPVVDVVTEGPKALGGLASPLVQSIDDQIRGQSLFTGRGFRVNGSPEENPNPDLVTRARIVGNQLTSTAFPLREIGKATAGGKTQGDDSLFFSPRPIKYAPGGTGEMNEKKRRAERGSVHDQIVRDVFPLFMPKPDNTRDIVAQRQREAGKAITVPAGKPTAPPDTLDWSKVSIPDTSSEVDWSKVRIP